MPTEVCIREKIKNEIASLYYVWLHEKGSPRKLSDCGSIIKSNQFPREYYDILMKYKGSAVQRIYELLKQWPLFFKIHHGFIYIKYFYESDSNEGAEHEFIQEAVEFFKIKLAKLENGTSSVHYLHEQRAQASKRIRAISGKKESDFRKFILKFSNVFSVTDSNVTLNLEGICINTILPKVKSSSSSEDSCSEHFTALSEADKIIRKTSYLHTISKFGFSEEDIEVNALLYHPLSSLNESEKLSNILQDPSIGNSNLLNGGSFLEESKNADLHDFVYTQTEENCKLFTKVNGTDFFNHYMSQTTSASVNARNGFLNNTSQILVSCTDRENGIDNSTNAVLKSNNETIRSENSTSMSDSLYKRLQTKDSFSNHIQNRRVLNNERRKSKTTVNLIFCDDSDPKIKLITCIDRYKDDEEKLIKNSEVDVNTNDEIECIDLTGDSDNEVESCNNAPKKDYRNSMYFDELEKITGDREINYHDLHQDRIPDSFYKKENICKPPRKEIKIYDEFSNNIPKDDVCDLVNEKHFNRGLSNSNADVSTFLSLTPSIRENDSDNPLVIGKFLPRKCSAIRPEILTLQSASEKDKIIHLRSDVDCQTFVKQVMDLPTKILILSGQFKRQSFSCKLCQLYMATTDGNVYLLDFEKFPEQMNRWIRDILFGSTLILKIFHDCRKESKALHQQFGIVMKNVFDTQVAYAVVKHMETKIAIDDIPLVSFKQLLSKYCNNSMLGCNMFGQDEESQCFKLKHLYPNIYSSLNISMPPEYHELFQSLCEEHIYAFISPLMVETQKRNRRQKINSSSGR